MSGTAHDKWVQDAFGVDVAQYAAPGAGAGAPAGASLKDLGIDVSDPLGTKAAVQKVAQQSAEAETWIRDHLRAGKLGPDPLGDGSGATVMFDNKTQKLEDVVKSTVAAGAAATLQYGGNSYITEQTVRRILTVTQIEQIPKVPGTKPFRKKSFYLQYTFTPQTVHTPLAGGPDSKDQPAHSLTAQMTFEFHAEDEDGLEISALGQATWFADDKGGRLQNQSGFTGGQVAWVWQFLDGALQAGPQFQALVGAARAQQKLTNKMEWVPTGQVGVGGQVQYAVPGFKGHLLVGVQAGVSGTGSQGADSTVDRSGAITLTWKF